MRTLRPSAPRECVLLVMIAQQLPASLLSQSREVPGSPPRVLRAVRLGLKSRGNSSILVSEEPCGSPDDLVGGSLSDELGALGRVEVPGRSHACLVSWQQIGVQSQETWLRSRLLCLCVWLFVHGKSPVLLVCPLYPIKKVPLVDNTEILDVS